MNDILWTAVLAQMLMGGFDTAWHHEGTQHLAWRPSQARELALRAIVGRTPMEQRNQAARDVSRASPAEA